VTPPPIEIRPATAAEVDLMVDWAAREGWNPGLHDATCFRAQAADGFLVALQEGEPIGGISAVSYGGFGFLGFYIVVPQARGQGHGIALWQQAMARLAGQVVGLDGVFAQQENYARSGFRFAYRNLRFEWLNRPISAPHERIATPDSVARAALLAYDRTCFPAPRERFLECWLALPESTTRVLLRGDEVAGYGTIRRCRSGWKVGPLFADDRAGATALLAALCDQAESGAAIYLDVPEPHAAAMALAAELEMREVFGTARMYLGAPPAITLERVFGVTTFELG